MRKTLATIFLSVLITDIVDTHIRRRQLARLLDLHSEDKIQENMAGWRRGWNDGLSHASRMTMYSENFDAAKLPPR